MMKYNFATFILTLVCFACLTSCSDDETTTNQGGNNNNGNTDEFVIYQGDPITFTKDDNSDETLEANQDRITENVWITRGTEGGEIFNIRSEASSTQGVSPAGTEWAQGTTADISNLTFTSFRSAIRPQDVSGVDLVLHLIEEDEYLDIKFSSWTQGRAGGFSYERSTK